MSSLQDLGAELVELSDERLRALAMPERLFDAIAEFKRTRSHEGRRRQMQYIGKLMREADETPLRQAIDEIKLGSARAAIRLHEVERWREELLADDDAVQRFARMYPGSDAQQLRRLVKAARADAAADPAKRSGRGYRELFRFIKPWLDSEAASTADSNHE